MDNISVQLITWNVGTKFPSPHTQFSSFFHDLEELGYPDVLLIGLQEVKSQPQNVVLDNFISGEDPWTSAFRTYLKPAGFLKVRSIRLVGIILSFFCKREHVPYLRELETQYTRLGFAGYWGSKGGVSVRFKLYGVSVCVVNSHLAAHDQFLQARLDSYNTIIDGHTYSQQETRHILNHDYVFWMGDLNFRLKEDGFTFEEIDLSVSKGDLGKLLAQDQLAMARKNGEAFSEFSENLPTFPPTYKFKINSDVYDNKRRPAWTDRILFQANLANYDKIRLSLNQHSYKSHPQFLESDHKPVSSSFSLAAFSKTLASEYLISCYEPIIDFQDAGPYFSSEDTKVVYEVKMENRKFMKIWDWIAIFRADASNLEDYIAYTWAQLAPNSQQLFETAFDESVFLPPSDYMLVYFSAGVRDILGISRPFSIRFRDCLNGAEQFIETGQEARVVQRLRELNVAKDALEQERSEEEKTDEGVEREEL